jgi:hypothetical protein
MTKPAAIDKERKRRKYYLESLQCHLRIEKYFRNRHRNDYSGVKTKVYVINIDKNIEKSKLQANNDKKFKKNDSNPKYQNHKKKEHCFECKGITPISVNSTFSLMSI